MHTYRNEEPMLALHLKRAAALCAALTCVSAAPPDPQAADPELYEIAREAYVYAYPIVTMDMTMRQMTNVPSSGVVAMRAPVNQFAHVRSYPGADDRSVVRVNFDTLYSIAWLDVSREPMVLALPEMGDRYYLFQMLDMWTDVFAVPGTRTTGNQAGRFAIVAPGWRGTLPEGVTKIEAPTPMVWIVGRTQTNGPADFENVHRAQDAYTLTPLGQWGKGYRPPGGAPIDPSVDNATEPAKQVNRLSGVAMLTRLAELMAKHPPHPNDYPILWRMRRIGIEVGRPFDAAKLDPASVAAIDAAGRDALDEMQKASRKGLGTSVHGWSISLEGIGAYGTDYRRRAIVSLAGLGANLPQDAVYPSSRGDAFGEPYSGENRYRLHFEKEELPPVGAFWSVTLYDDAGYQVPNPLGRFALGDRDPLQYNEDGSLDLFIESESPGADKESNWLPAPPGRFNLAMRLYAPRSDVLDGSWQPPGVLKVTRRLPKRNR
jgi:hypothetical protein